MRLVPHLCDRCGGFSNLGLWKRSKMETLKGHTHVRLTNGTKSSGSAGNALTGFGRVDRGMLGRLGGVECLAISPCN